MGEEGRGKGGGGGEGLEGRGKGSEWEGMGVEGREKGGGNMEEWERYEGKNVIISSHLTNFLPQICE